MPSNSPDSKPCDYFLSPKKPHLEIVENLLQVVKKQLKPVLIKYFHAVCRF